MRTHILRTLRLATIAAVVIPAALAASLAACSARESGEAGTNAAAAQAGPFTCPMHPSYVSNQPGDCPICNMKLVPVASLGGPSAGNSIPGRAAVSIPSDLQGRIGLRTVAIEREPFSRTIRAVARIEANERGLSIVSLRTGGWIEELFVQATGDLVHPGDPLLSVYSPELFEAQQSYLLARASLGVEDEAVLGLRERLLLLDLTSDQVTALEARGSAAPRTTFLAKSGGVVIRREATLGMRVEAGATLFEIADLSTVWVIADIYEEEIPLVKTGARASIELPSAPGATIEGVVTFVYPTLAEATRTARVRIEVPNPDGSLRPGSYATARIASDLGEQLVVNVDAILDTGTRRIAYVEVTEGSFEPREVELGARSGGRAVVLSGLDVGDRVVASAAFLVDSESRLKAALHGATKPAEGHQHH